MKIKALTEELAHNGTKVSLIWIPSHIGIHGNEKADFLAKEAIRDGIDSQIDLPLEEIKNHWRSLMVKELTDWCHHESINRGSFCRNFLEEGRHPWFKNFNTSRRTVTSICRLRSCHTSLKASLYHFKIVDSPLCTQCKVEETEDHVFWNCMNFSSQRKILKRELTRARGSFPHSVEYLLTTLKDDIIYAIDKFINSQYLHLS